MLKSFFTCSGVFFSTFIYISNFNRFLIPFSSTNSYLFFSWYLKESVPSLFMSSNLISFSYNSYPFFDSSLSIRPALKLIKWYIPTSKLITTTLSGYKSGWLGFGVCWFWSDSPTINLNNHNECQGMHSTYLCIIIQERYKPFFNSSLISILNISSISFLLTC